MLYVIACGGRPAADLPAFVEGLRSDGWTVCVVSTPSGLKFLDAARLAGITGHPVRSDYKRPEEPDVLPPADAMAVAPATFNTVNKWAHGTSDTLALGLLNEAVGPACPSSRRPGPTRPWPAIRSSGAASPNSAPGASPSCWTRPGCGAGLGGRNRGHVPLGAAPRRPVRDLGPPRTRLRVRFPAPARGARIVSMTINESPEQALVRLGLDRVRHRSPPS